jgi:hypothetical protein
MPSSVMLCRVASVTTDDSYHFDNGDDNFLYVNHVRTSQETPVASISSYGDRIT